MIKEITGWGLGVITSVGFLGGVGYIMRDAIGKFLTKSFEHKFERKLEAFKADIREGEKELEQIRTFLVAARRDRDQALQAKKLEAAESMMRARRILAEFTLLVEYMKGLKSDELLKKGDDPKTIEFINTLIKPINIDDKLAIYGSFDKTSLYLYVSERTLKVFNIYEMIMLHAATMMKIYSFSLRNKEALINKWNISKTIIEIVPASKEGFEKYGEEYALYWANYFHDEILKALRMELHGADNMVKDAESATRMALDSRNAQVKLRSALEHAGLSEQFLNLDINKGGDV